MRKAWDEQNYLNDRQGIPGIVGIGNMGNWEGD